MWCRWSDRGGGVAGSAVAVTRLGRCCRGVGGDKAAGKRHKGCGRSEVKADGRREAGEQRKAGERHKKSERHKMNDVQEAGWETRDAFFFVLCLSEESCRCGVGGGAFGVGCDRRMGRERVLFWLVEGRLRRCGVCVGAGLRLGGAVMGVARA